MTGRFLILWIVFFLVSGFAAGGISKAGPLVPFPCSNRLNDEMERGIARLMEQVEKLSRIIRGIPDSEEYKAIEKDLEQLADELKLSGESMKKKIQKEVLPRLKKEMDSLRERLRELIREKDLKPLKTRMKLLREV